MNKLKSIHNSSFKDSLSHPIHPCFPIIPSIVNKNKFNDHYFQQESRQCIHIGDELVTGVLSFTLIKLE